MVKVKKSIIIEEGKIPPFNSIDVTVRTIIVISNLDIDVGMVYQYVPITDLKLVKKKRGRKKKNAIIVPPIILPAGSIVSSQFESKKRGVFLKKKKKGKKKRDYFPHSVTLGLIINDHTPNNRSCNSQVITINKTKQVSIKVSSKGKFHITGCRTERHYVDTMIHLYNNFKKIESYIGHPIIEYLPLNKSKIEDKTSLDVKQKYETQGYRDGEDNIDQKFGRDIVDYPIMIFNRIMNNKDYAVPFNINRQKLTTFMHNHTDFTADFDPDVDTSINIKIKNSTPNDASLLMLSLTPNVLSDWEKQIDITNDSYINDKSLKNIQRIPYNMFYSMLDNIDKEKLKVKHDKEENLHSIIAFHSGSFIQSGRGPEQERIYNLFLDIIFKNQNEFKEDIIDDEKKIQLYSVFGGIGRVKETFKYSNSLKKMITIIKKKETDKNMSISLYYNSETITTKSCGNSEMKGICKQIYFKQNTDFQEALRKDIDIYIDRKLNL